MLRRKTGCFTMGFTDLASDTDLDAEGNRTLSRIKTAICLESNNLLIVQKFTDIKI